MERDCESELSKLNIEQNACIYHFGASVIHGQRSNILRLRRKQQQIQTPQTYCIRKKWISQSLKEVQTGIYAQRRCVHTLVIDIENAGIFSMPA